MQKFLIFLLLPSMSLILTVSSPGKLPVSIHASIPVIMEVSLSSNNNCEPYYVTDGDLITCSFTTTEPCILSPPSSEMMLLNPWQDYRHWICIYYMKGGELPDQGLLTARQILDSIFNQDYRYYGTNPGITYFAPIEYTYDLISADDFYLLELESNHPIQLLTPECFSDETGHYWSISIIDAAGNGPLCITFPLEDTDVLLYNLSSMESACSVLPSASNEK